MEEGNKEKKIVGYQLRCHNEWCSGPENWGWSNEKPTTPQHCPVCNWLALPKDGIRAIFEC